MNFRPIRIRRHRDQLAYERELLERVRTAPTELRGCWWALYRAARAYRDRRPVINRAWQS